MPQYLVAIHHPDDYDLGDSERAFQNTATEETTK
jgi:hypothetical protein